MDPGIALSIALIVIFGLPVFIFAIIAWMVVRLAGGGRKQQRASAEEVRMMQEMHHNLRRMEERLESLEVILADREARKTV